jgi:peptidoglycan/xylan/chitin deacetylase (PgdA/CDA1 family)
MTNDVETTSLELNRPADFMAEKIKDIGLPRLLDIYAKYDVESTFFFTAHIIKMVPEIIDTVKENGHEIGCHGYNHEPEYFFDSISFEKQVHYLQLSKKIIEKEANVKVVTFRGPEARINEDTIRALEILKFKYDSSICPQRFDGPLSRGLRKKIFWMIAPRRPYYISKKSITQEGDSKILEIPISALIFPFIGNTMRVSPNINRILKKIIFFEAKKRNTPVVFVFHPTECVEIDRKLLNQKEKIHGSIFSGIVRKNIKLKNLGNYSIKLLENIIKQAKKEDFQFLSIKKYVKMNPLRDNNEEISLGKDR